MLALQTVGKLALAASLWFQLCLSLPADHLRLGERATGSLASFIASESPIALQGVLNNIGNTGSKAPGAWAGITIASPSTSNPNCMLPISTVLSASEYQSCQVASNYSRGSSCRLEA